MRAAEKFDRDVERAIADERWPRDQADDVRQEVFLRLHRRGEELRHIEDDALLGFLRKVARDIRIDLLRKQKRSRIAESLAMRRESTSDVDGEVQVEWQDFMDSQPARDQRLVVGQINGQSHEELADREFCSSRTVYRVFRGLKLEFLQ